MKASVDVISQADWELVREKIKSQDRGLAAWLNVTRFEHDGSLGRLVCATRLALARLQAVQIEELIRKEFRQSFQRDVPITLEVGEVALPEAPPIELVQASPRPTSLVLMGAQRGTKGATLPIREITAPMRNVIVEGFALNPEFRDLYKPLLRFIVTDLTDSIRVTLFDPPQKLREISPGDRVRIRG